MSLPTTKSTLLKDLLELWQFAKEEAHKHPTVEEQFKQLQQQKPDVSYLSFIVVLIQMRKYQLEGIPYIDCLTFPQWRELGFVVKKGERSMIQGLRWVDLPQKETKEHSTESQSEETSKMKNTRPVIYYLFHKSQVEKMELQPT